MPLSHRWMRRARVADEIIQMSGALSEKFDSAREKADVLTESMVSSNNSVKEIASSVKLTAEAIEQQTMQTNGIQTNIENAEKRDERDADGVRWRHRTRSVRALT